MRRAVLPALAMLGALAGTALGAEQRLDLTLGLRGTYDSNLLQYSDDQRARFENDNGSGRFSIEQLGDLVATPSAALAWELGRGGGRSHRLRLRADGDFHRVNGTADHRAFDVEWRESFRDARRWSLGWYRMPSYYLRQLFDEDSVPPAGPTYRRAEFSLDILSTAWSQRIARQARLELRYDFERRRYNPDFRERDSDTHQGEARVTLTGLPGRAEVAIGAGWRVSDASGTDGGDPPGVTPDDPDLDYQGFVGGIRGRSEMARRGPWRVIGTLAWEFGTRGYGSDRPADRYHFGRDDVTNAVEAGLRVQRRPHWSARGFWRYETNDARLGTAAPSSTDVGSYDQSIFGLAVEWTGTLWHASAGAAEEYEEAPPAARD